MSSQDTSDNVVVGGGGGTDIAIANLYSVIDKDKVYGLNLVVPEDARAVIKPWDERDDTTRYVQSGVDDQVVLHVPFTRVVRVRSVLLKLGRGETSPRRLRVYANRPTIVDFADAETIIPHLDTSLRDGDLSGGVVVEYPLRVAAFTSVTSLSLFFSDSLGQEVSRVYYVGFKGDMRSSQRETDQKLYVPAQNAADAPLVDKVAQKTAGQQTTAR